MFLKKLHHHPNSYPTYFKFNPDKEEKITGMLSHPCPSD
jgi:hypothetical protein